jgi:hypothetical protein
MCTQRSGDVHCVRIRSGDENSLSEVDNRSFPPFGSVVADGGNGGFKVPCGGGKVAGGVGSDAELIAHQRVCRKGTNKETKAFQLVIELIIDHWRKKPVVYDA